MTDQPRASWLVYVLGALCAGAIVAAFLLVGPASQSATAQDRVVAAQQGVVQSTVSGSGNIQAASQLDLGFKTSGVVTHIYVTQGAQVTPGQLLATLNPESAEVTLEQAKASLQAAEASLAHEEEDGGENASSPSGQSSPSAAAAEALPLHAGATSAAPATQPATPTPATQHTATTTTPTSRRTATHTQGTGTRATGAGTQTTTSTTAVKQTESAATREAKIASARAAVRSDRLTVQSDEQAVSDTRLYAPESGTIVSLSGEVGENVSASGTTKATSDSTSGGASSGAASTSSRLGGGAAGGSSAAASSTSGSTSSSASFAVLSDLSSMQLVVPLSESEVGSVRDGQPATVTVEALESRKLAAEVVNVATLPTSNSGVVSYDVTFQLDQTTGGLKPGMSASAEVVVKQATGVNVPTTAISGGSVTVVRNGKQLRQAIVTGLAGNSSTIVLSGLKAGEEVALPVAANTSAGGIAARLGGRTGGALGGTPGGGGAGFAGGALVGGGGGFRGGGGGPGG
jgi:multidrug efflux pump subunit AcrA (membrane-fusion protein)